MTEEEREPDDDYGDPTLDLRGGCKVMLLMQFVLWIAAAFIGVLIIIVGSLVAVATCQT